MLAGEVVFPAVISLEGISLSLSTNKIWNQAVLLAVRRRGLEVSLFSFRCGCARMECFKIMLVWILAGCLCDEDLSSIHMLIRHH